MKQKEKHCINPNFHACENVACVCVASAVVFSFSFRRSECICVYLSCWWFFAENVLSYPGLKRNSWFFLSARTHPISQLCLDAISCCGRVFLSFSLSFLLLIRCMSRYVYRNKTRKGSENQYLLYFVVIVCCIEHQPNRIVNAIYRQHFSAKCRRKREVEKKTPYEEQNRDTNLLLSGFDCTKFRNGKNANVKREIIYLCLEEMGRHIFICTEFANTWSAGRTTCHWSWVFPSLRFFWFFALSMYGPRSHKCVEWIISPESHAASIITEISFSSWVTSFFVLFCTTCQCGQFYTRSFFHSSLFKGVLVWNLRASLFRLLFIIKCCFVLKR